LDGPAVALVIDDDRRRYFVPVPGFVRVVLEVTSDAAGRDVEGHRGRRVQIVARALVAHPRAAVAGAPEREVRFGIVRASHPDRPTAGLPLIAFRPCLAARLARSR